MSWLDVHRDPIDWSCVYCGEAGHFPHVSSYEFKNFAYHLHRCTGCRSLIYDPNEMGPLFGLRPGGEDTRIGVKYYFEFGYSASFAAHCALSTIPDIGLDELKNYNFLDIGAGNGVGSYIARDLFGLSVQAVEPSETGEYARRIFNLPVERKYFEEIDEALLSRLKSRPCLVHLDAVIEHLNDPRTLLQNLVKSLDIEVLCGLVPDGDAISRDDPFTLSVPFLAPSDHVHLPTADGMARMFAELGFPHVHVAQTTKLLIVTGSRRPVQPPSEQRVALATQLLLERLAQHSNPWVANGAAVHMLIEAIGKGDRERIDFLWERFAGSFEPNDMLEKITSGAPWDDIPFYSGALAYWLSVNALNEGRPEETTPYLDVTEAYAERIARDFPQFSMGPQMYKWEARMMRAHCLALTGRADEASRVLRGVIASGADPYSPAEAAVIERAEAALARLPAAKAAA